MNDMLALQALAELLDATNKIYGGVIITLGVSSLNFALTGFTFLITGYLLWKNRKNT